MVEVSRLINGLGLALSPPIWALNPPLQASTIEAAPDSAMSAISLNISGLYLGTAIAGALGGILTDTLGPAWIPPAAVLLLTAAWIIATFNTPASPHVSAAP